MIVIIIILEKCSVISYKAFVCNNCYRTEIVYYKLNSPSAIIKMLRGKVHME